MTELDRTKRNGFCSQHPQTGGGLGGLASDPQILRVLEFRFFGFYFEELVLTENVGMRRIMKNNLPMRGNRVRLSRAK